MTILLAICLLLVMVCLIMALNAFTRLDRLRHQNELMQKELVLLRQEYLQLQERVIGGPAAAQNQPQNQAQTEAESQDAATAPAPEKKSPQDILQDQLAQFQTILEAYRRQQSGRFPASRDELTAFANRYGLQKTVENPFTGARNPLLSEDVCLDITHDLIDEGLPEYAGRLLFQAHLDPRGQVTGYFLTALDQRGMLLKRPDGEALTLSHQG